MLELVYLLVVGMAALLSFKILKAPSLREIVYSAVKDAIGSGNVKADNPEPEAKPPSDSTVSIEISMPKVVRVDVDEEELLSYIMYNRMKQYFLELVMTEKARISTEGKAEKEEKKEEGKEEKSSELPVETLLNKGLLKEG